MGRSRRTGGTFGSSPTGTRKSRGELIRERYSTDRYPTAEDFIRAVEEDPEHFDPASDQFFPNDYGRKFSSTDRPGLRGVSGNNLKGGDTRGKSNWIADNPIDVDVDVDPGSLSVSAELYGDENNSVRAVAGVDLVPLGIDINVNGDVGSIGVELGAPGDMFGVNASVSFDVTTGEVIGGGVGLEGGGLAVSVDRTSHKGKTCTSITVTFFGVGASYQHCEDEEDDDEDDEDGKEPPPGSDDDEGLLPDPPITQIPGDQNRYCHIIIGNNFKSKTIRRKKGTCQGDIDNINESLATSPQYQPSPTGGVIITASTTWIRTDTVVPSRSHNYEGSGWFSYFDGWHYSEGSTVGPTVDRKSGLVYQMNEILKNRSNRQDIKNTTYGADGCDELLVFSSVAWPTVSVYFPDTGEIIPPPEKPKEPIPPIPPIPPEDDVTECCNLEPVMSMLRKLNQALAVDEVIGEGLDLPNEWILPTGKGHTKMQNYLQIAVFLAKMQDHLGVHPMTVQIADLSAGQEGNQQFKKFYPNGTKAIQEILTILQDENADSADRLNLQMRLAILNTRIFVTVASIARSLRGIFQFLGAPLKEKRDVVPLPFDYTYGMRKNKGFSQNAAQDGKQLEEVMNKIEAELNKNTESATEALLAKFLNDSDQPIMFETFDNAQPDLLTLLRAINTQLGKNNGNNK